MATRKKRETSPWSHEALEKRGYKKCPLCWRHVVKIEEHIAAHEAGLIGADGKRRDRTPDEQRRWAERYNGRPATARVRRAFVSRAQVDELLRLPGVDFRSFREQVDAAVDQEP